MQLKKTVPPYSMLYSLARNAWDTAEQLAGTPHTQCQLSAQDLYVITLDYAIASLEAYINHLGFIFIDHWAVLQKKHFWGQYEQLRGALKRLKVMLPEEPIFDYRAMRDKRNQLHHTHTAEAESLFISALDAKEVLLGVASFMRDTQQRILSGLKWYESLEAALLDIKEAQKLDARQALLDAYLQGPVPEV